MRSITSAASVSVLLLASVASAEEPVVAPAQDGPVVVAPPGKESGRIDDGDRDSPLRVIGRAVLFVPRIAVEVVFAPVRSGVFWYESYDGESRFLRWFFNDDQTVGLYPTAQLDSIYGVSVGARFVHRNLFGAHEHLSLRATIGGQYRSRVGLGFRTGDRLGENLELEVAAESERRPKDRFYGIGNDDVAVEARYRQRLARARAVVDLRVEEELHVRGSGALTDIDFEQSDIGPPIDLLYDTDNLTGWDGVRELYGELELRWDTRRPGRKWDPPLARSTGSFVSLFAGRAFPLEDGSDYTRYGLDLQRFVRLADGPRVLVARLYGEGVTGSIEDVPFTELPQLGGHKLLRGYPIDRFRDRVSAMGSLEYRWDLSYRITGSTFVDVGRVYPSLEDLSVDDLRLGYGVGVEYSTTSHFIAQLSVASSIDGGLFFNFNFDPVFDVDPRVKRQ